MLIHPQAFFNRAYFAGGTLYNVIRGVFIVVVAMFGVYTDMLFAVDIDGQDASCDFENFFRLGLQSSSCCITVGGKFNSFRNSILGDLTRTKTK